MLASLSSGSTPYGRRIARLLHRAHHTSRWTFTQGLIVGQISMVVVALLLIRYVIFEDSATALEKERLMRIKVSERRSKRHAKERLQGARRAVKPFNPYTVQCLQSTSQVQQTESLPTIELPLSPISSTRPPMTSHLILLRAQTGSTSCLLKPLPAIVRMCSQAVYRLTSRNLPSSQLTSNAWLARHPLRS